MWEKFLDKQETHDLMKNSIAIHYVDFCYDHNIIIPKLQEITDYLIDHGNSGYFWILTNKTIYRILSYASCFASFTDQMLLGNDIPAHSSPFFSNKEIHCVGILQRTWRVYVDPRMLEDKILIGCNFSDFRHNAMLVIRSSNDV
jgi:hypothetical protein